jgi:hypothetical protein
MSRSAPSFAMTSADSRSLSPKIDLRTDADGEPSRGTSISLVETVSFSLMMGIARCSSRRASVLRRFKYRTRFAKSSSVKRIWATVMPWRWKACS